MIIVDICILGFIQGCCMQCPVAVGWAQFLPCKVLSHCEVSRHSTSVKVQNGLLVYDPMLIPWQLRFSLYSGAVITEGRCSLFTSLLQFLSWPCPMPYAWVVASCSVGCLLSDCSLDLAFPIAGCLYLFSLSVVLSDPLNISLISRVPPLLNSGIACLGEPWDSMSGFPELWLARCIVG